MMTNNFQVCFNARIKEVRLVIAGSVLHVILRSNLAKPLQKRTAMAPANDQRWLVYYTYCCIEIILTGPCTRKRIAKGGAQ